jgi:hypothetical protein
MQRVWFSRGKSTATLRAWNTHVAHAVQQEFRNKWPKSCVCPKRRSDAWEQTMRMNLCYAAFGLAVAASTGPANAQTVITREVVSPPIDTVVTQPATETVITRQPIATMPAETVVEEPYQTVETIQTTRPARTVSRQVTTTRQVVRNHKSARERCGDRQPAGRA